jgi:hypothetical protein
MRADASTNLRGAQVLSTGAGILDGRANHQQ